ncbi:MAG: GNAT family N-acetyltransferase, partial [Herpetosiphonaceae bacterium]|nr:GNAT family N-acetyltransferase [Herpetosiphonaceae bacterium]
QSLYIPPGAPPFPRQVVADAKIARYVQGWGRPGDCGVMAMDQEQPIGAAWSRRLTGAEPGFGYLDDQTPELGIAIMPLYRGKGIGTFLLEQLLTTLADQAAAVSLSVSRDNPALQLYTRLGFVVVGEDTGGSFIMKKTLTPPV